MIRILASVVFVIFGVFAGYATHALGYGIYGIPLAILTTAGLLWEIWIQPARDEAETQRILSDIENFREMLGNIKSPTNIQDAKNQINDLSVQLATVSDAYVELREVQEEKETEDESNIL